MNLHSSTGAQWGLSPFALTGSSVAAEDEAAGEDANVFAPGLGLRAGLAVYPNTTSHEIASPRATGSLYYHFAEREDRRLEGALSYFASQKHPAENRYFVVDLKYVGYLGGAGLVSWSAGGGLLFEDLYGTQSTFGYVGASIGYWLLLGQKGLDLRLAAHVPMGENLNALMMAAFTVGYDF